MTLVFALAVAGSWAFLLGVADIICRGPRP